MTDHKAERRFADELAQEIRRVDGNHSLGAGALAEALKPFMFSKYAEWANLGQMPPAAPAASEGEDGDAHDVAVWSLIGIAEECGAEKDEGDDGRGPYWTLHVDAMYALEERMRNAVNAMRYAEAETRPAAQVAATPKHDEGRDFDTWHDSQWPAPGRHAPYGHTVSWRREKMQRRVVWDAALATQPAARRVTELEVSAAADRLVRKWNLHGPDAYRMANDALNAAAESFAQPAEGVCGG